MIILVIKRGGLGENLVGAADFLSSLNGNYSDNSSNSSNEERGSGGEPGRVGGCIRNDSLPQIVEFQW